MIEISSSIQQASIATMDAVLAFFRSIIFSENVIDATNTATKIVKNAFARSFDSE